MAALHLMLKEFVADHERKAQVWGEVDCCLVLADWLVWQGYTDPAMHLRGSYHDADQCRAVVAQAGGLVPLVEECNRKVGWRRVERQSVGSVAVIGSPKFVNRQWGAIWSGERWLVRMENGFLDLTAKPIVIWSR